MKIHGNINMRRQTGRISFISDTFSALMECDWHGMYKGPYLRNIVAFDQAFPSLKFGVAEPWKWMLDLSLNQMDGGAMLLSQGYRELEGRRVPFMRQRFWVFDDADMLYGVVETRHLSEQFSRLMQPLEEGKINLFVSDLEQINDDMTS